MAQPASTEDSFRLLVESMPDYAIFMLDTTGRVVSWNKGAERLKGYRAEEIIGRHYSCFHEPTDVASRKWQRELEIAAREGRYEEDGWRVRKDGSRFWANVVLTALRNASGELVGFAKVERDLTARRKAEMERLRTAQVEEAERVEHDMRRSVEDARRWFETTLRSIGDAVITTDAEGKVTLMNSVAEQLTGHSLAMGRGKPLADVFHIVNELTRVPLENPAERVLRDGLVIGLANHTVLVRPDGSEVALADSAAPIRDESGAVRGVILVFRDATPERTAAERRAFMGEVTAALASSLDYTETLRRVANLAVPRLADWCVVHVIDDDGKLAQVGVAHSDPTKLEAALAMGKRFKPRDGTMRGANEVARTGRSILRALVTPDMLAEAAESPEHLKLLRELQFHSVMIVPLTTGPRVLGTITFVYASSGRTYDDDALAFAEELGRRAGMAVENARLYGAEQRARESADAANRAKDEFLAAVSHELRTPLTAIVGWSKMLSAGKLEEPQRTQAIATIERNGVMMTQLIEDLLDVSRIVSGKMRVHMRPLEVAPFVEAALDSMKPLAEAKAIAIERDLVGDVPMISGDAARLQQVVWNLISNAVKFTPRGGHVRVSVRRDGGAIEIAVSDDGKGIVPKFLPFVFDAFRQAEGGIARAAGGLGLGLAITKHLVELHGGSIEAKSEGEGRGSTFVVRLPVPERPSAPEAGEPEPEPPPHFKGLRVLVVDDEEDARALIAAVLEHAGATVRTASSAAEALAAIHAEVPDVLLSDIGMPGETGYDLIRRVRALPPSAGGQVPAGALTAYARDDDRRKALAAGFTMHVPKPIDPSELVAVVGALGRAR